MIRYLVVGAACISLSALTGCAADTADAPEASEQDLTKKIKVLGDIEIASANEYSSNGTDEPSTSLRAFRFKAEAGDIVDVSVYGKFELTLRDSKSNVIADGKDDGDGSVVISAAKLTEAGTYLIAFRNLDAKGQRPSIQLTRNYSESPVAAYKCKTDSKIGDAIEEFSFDIAFPKDAKQRVLLPVLKERDPNEYGLMIAAGEDGYAMTLNENISYSFDDGKFSVNGDGDGIVFVDLVLYENTNFTRGFFRTSRELDAYSTVTCTVSDQKGQK